MIYEFEANGEVLDDPEYSDPDFLKGDAKFFVHEKLELTGEQEKAWKAFEKAFKQCKKTGILFYVVLDSVYAMNGHNVERVHDDGSPQQDYKGSLDSQDVCLNDVNLPFIRSYDLAGWADDTHYARLKKRQPNNAMEKTTRNAGKN